MIFGRIIFRSIVDESLENLKRVENLIDDYLLQKNQILKKF